jgi:hypothetical protein
MITLRPYQELCVADLRASYASGHRAPLLQLPTGGGKTIVFAAIVHCAHGKQKRTLVVAHRRIGDATLYLADCRLVIPTVTDIDCVVTDPPYGVDLGKRTPMLNRRYRGTYGSYDDTPENVLKVCVPVIRECMTASVGW